MEVRAFCLFFEVAVLMVWLGPQRAVGFLGGPVVPFTLFLVLGSLTKVANQNKGALVIMWLLGY